MNTDIKNLNIDNEPKCSICVYSSLIFVTNVFSALYYNHYFYAFLFLCLTITSVVHHTYNTFYTGIIDKIPVYAVILYGGFIFYDKYIKELIKDLNTDLNTTSSKTNIKAALIVSTFLSVVFLYTYGYLTDNYSFHTSHSVSQMYHGLLHIISSIGHHFIISL
jgi:hypothetical protein